jgi:hypothetical protein
MTRDAGEEGDRYFPDVSWHPALSKEQREAIRAGKLRAYIYAGALVIEATNGQGTKSEEK